MSGFCLVECRNCKKELEAILVNRYGYCEKCKDQSPNMIELKNKALLLTWTGVEFVIQCHYCQTVVKTVRVGPILISDLECLNCNHHGYSVNETV